MRGRFRDDLGSLANGILLGAGGMYLLDPDRGARRRAEVRQQASHLAHRLDEGLDTTSRDVRNRVRGLQSRSRRVVRAGEVTDDVVVARVRSRLGRLVRHPSSIEVVAGDGVVTLRGPVLADEVMKLLAGVRGVRGVREVLDELEVHEEAGDVPGLQGNPRRPERRPELLQENWAPATRLWTGALAAGLGVRGWETRGPVGTAMMAMSGGLLTRSLTNLRLRRVTGVAAGRRAIDVRKTITVAAPLERVFDFWADFENLPRFMKHLKEVRTAAGGRSRWTATGPLGVSVSWEAEITAFEPGRLIAWKSVGTSAVASTGIVRFETQGPERTRVEIRMSYNPPAGALGHVVASIFGVDPKHAMDDDLVRFKSLIEEGKTTAAGREVMV